MSDKPSNPPSRAYALMLGAFLIPHVIWLFYLGLTGTFDGPPWVAYVMGVIFLTGAAQILAMAWGHAGRGKWVAFIWLVGFSSLFWWVTIVADPRTCSTSIGPFSLPLGCKIPFGFFALIFTAYTIHVAREWFLPRRKSYY